MCVFSDGSKNEDNKSLNLTPTAVAPTAVPIIAIVVILGSNGPIGPDVPSTLLQNLLTKPLPISPKPVQRAMSGRTECCEGFLSHHSLRPLYASFFVISILPLV
jgi:hypothetical protein